MKTFGSESFPGAARSALRRRSRCAALIALAGAALLAPIAAAPAMADDDDKRNQAAKQPSRPSAGGMRDRINAMSRKAEPAPRQAAPAPVRAAPAARPSAPAPRATISATPQPSRPSSAGMRNRIPPPQPAVRTPAPSPRPSAVAPAPQRPSVVGPQRSQPGSMSNAGIRNRIPQAQPRQQMPQAQPSAIAPRPSAPPPQRPSVVVGPQRSQPGSMSNAGIRNRIPQAQPRQQEPAARPSVIMPRPSVQQPQRPAAIQGPDRSRPSAAGMRDRIPVRPSTPIVTPQPPRGGFDQPLRPEPSRGLGDRGRDRGGRDWGNRDHGGDRGDRNWRDNRGHDDRHWDHDRRTHWDRDHWRRDRGHHHHHSYFHRPRPRFSLSIGLGSPFYCPPPAYVANPFVYYSTAYCAPRFSYHDHFYSSPVYWYRPSYYRYPRSSFSLSIGSGGKFRTSFSWLYDFRFGHVPAYPVSHCTTLVSPAVVHVVDPYPVYVESAGLSSSSISSSGWFGSSTVGASDSGSVGVVLPPPQSTEYPPVQAAPRAVTSDVELGHTYLQLGDGESAMRVLLGHISQYQNDTEAIRGIALAYLLLGEVDNGIRQIGRAYRMSPWLSGRPLDGLLSPQDHAYALDITTQVAMQQNSADAWLTVAVLMQAEGRHASARQAIERARTAGLQSQVVDSFLAVLPENDN